MEISEAHGEVGDGGVRVRFRVGVVGASKLECNDGEAIQSPTSTDAFGQFEATVLGPRRLDHARSLSRLLIAGNYVCPPSYWPSMATTRLLEPIQANEITDASTVGYVDLSARFNLNSAIHLELRRSKEPKLSGLCR